MNRRMGLIFILSLIVFIAGAGCVSKPSPSQQIESSMSKTPTKSTPTPLHVPKTTSPRIWSDSHVGLVLTGVERTDQVPESFELSKIRPDPGNDFVLVKVSISFIDNITIKEFGKSEHRGDGATLTTDTGKKYPVSITQLEGLGDIDLYDISKITIGIKTRTTFVFEIPIEEKPIHINIPYQYVPKNDGLNVQYSQIGIDL